MGNKKYSRRQLPPCPDPESYTLVKTSKGYYWRKRRGSVKPALLNRILSRNAATSKISGPAASRILQKLELFTRGLKTGRIHMAIASRLMKTYHAKGIIDFSMLEDLELSSDHPLEKLLYSEYVVRQEGQHIQIVLSTGSVRQHNKLVTDYYFDAILLYGDPGSDVTLTVASKSSGLFSFADKVVQKTELLLPLPATIWMLLLKVSCLEGNEMAAHPKHYGMKVVKTGN